MVESNKRFTEEKSQIENRLESRDSYFVNNTLVPQQRKVNPRAERSEPGDLCAIANPSTLFSGLTLQPGAY